jgi:uncharacterized protein DUF4381
MDPEQIPLRDLHLPEAVGWWPLAPGWWILLTFAVAGLSYLLYKAYRQWQQNAARRLALKELSRVRRDYENGADPILLCKQLSELLRRSMLAYAPRAEVAGLTGNSWLMWLDTGLDDRPFSEGAGKDLPTLPYQRPETITLERDISGMIDAVYKRLRTPLAGTKG